MGRGMVGEDLFIVGGLSKLEGSAVVGLGIGEEGEEGNEKSVPLV